MTIQIDEGRRSVPTYRIFTWSFILVHKCTISRVISQIGNSAMITRHPRFSVTKFAALVTVGANDDAGHAILHAAILNNRNCEKDKLKWSYPKSTRNRVLSGRHFILFFLPFSYRQRNITEITECCPKWFLSKMKL